MLTGLRSLMRRVIVQACARLTISPTLTQPGSPKSTTAPHAHVDPLWEVRFQAQTKVLRTTPAVHYHARRLSTVSSRNVALPKTIRPVGLVLLGFRVSLKYCTMRLSVVPRYSSRYKVETLGMYHVG